MDKKNKTSRSVKLGWILGILSSASFGLIPLFSIPVLEDHIDVGSVVFYRFLFACLLIGGFHLFKRKKLILRREQLLPVSLMSILYIFSAVLLIQGFRYMPSGVATVIHFMYPIFLILLLRFFFAEKISYVSVLAITIALLGVSFIMGLWNIKSLSVPLVPFILVLLSGISYACYIVIVQHSKAKYIEASSLTLYVLSFACLGIFLYLSISHQGISQIGNLRNLLSLFLLALIPTVLSNLTLIYAIKSIGPTATSVLGAIEPLTAVFVGIIVFQEPLTTLTFTGILLIIIAVSLVISSAAVEKKLSNFLRIGLNKKGKRNPSVNQ